MFTRPIGSMYGIYANIGGILMVNVAIYSIHGSYGRGYLMTPCGIRRMFMADKEFRGNVAASAPTGASNGSHGTRGSN
jgi:hypothetical protein